MSIDPDKMIERRRYWDETIEPKIERGEAVPIVPELRICVHAFEGDAVRFAAIFRNVWKRLPSDDRYSIYSYWCNGFLGSGFSPLIALYDYWKRRNDGDLGAAQLLGHRLVFHTPSVDKLSDAAVTELVAHELAHVFQYATHPHPHMIAMSDDPEIEIDADVIVELWGFELYVIEEDLRSGRLEEAQN